MKTDELYNSKMMGNPSLDAIGLKINLDKKHIL